MAVAGDVDLEPPGQGIDHRDPHAVQSAADRVAAVLTAEFAARMELRHHYVDGGGTGGVHGDRDTAAVVNDLDTTVFEDPHIALAGVAGHRLVHRVVDHLPNEVVQTSFPGGPDVHAGAFADRLQPFEHGDR